ncbi:MAG: NUDIX domain-containing protein, partial [Chloroflexota bacterium]|nr:NUDIX domain-containing protein [Chloroflexota bacterium]
MLRLAQDGMRFSVRVGAVCLCDGHVLLAGTEADGFWILPGGHGELLERTDDTIRRELREELEVEVEVGRLLWVVENFFIYAGVRSHSISFIFEAHLPVGCDLLDTTRDFEGTDEG